MLKILKLLMKDLLLRKKFTILFIFNLSLGLTGFVTLDSFRYNLESSMDMRSRLVLGADLGMSSRQILTDAHKVAVKQVIGENSQLSEMTELYSMVANLSGDSRLIQIKAIDNKYPFYGAINLKNQGPQSPDKAYDIMSAQKVWVYPEVLAQLNLKVGEKLKIGEAEFEISDQVLDDSASGFSTSMAPRIYIGRNQLPNTKLITPQSLAWYSVVYKRDTQSEAELQGLIESIFEQPAISAGVRVYSHKNVSQQMSRMLRYLSDYLGLVSIAAIFLSSIGTAFLFRSYLRSKIKEIAILNSIGLNLQKIISLYFAKVFCLGILASILTFCFAQILAPLLAFMLDRLVSVPIQTDFRFESLAVAIVLATIGSLLICAPILLQLKDIKASHLFQESEASGLKSNWWSIAAYFCSLAALYFLSVWQAHSWLIGSSFFGLFIVSAAALGIFALLLIRLFNRFGHKLPLTLKISIRNLCKQPTASISCFIALSLGVLLLNIIPQIEASLQAEIQQPNQSKLPTFFLFDIQSEQVEELKKVVAHHGGKLNHLSPMIRARLIKINENKFEKTNANKDRFSREEEQEARSRNRGFNLSYRENISDSESIIAGRDFSGIFNPEKDEVAEISIETRFAKRIGAKIGDVLHFDVQSVPIIGKIVNMRSVRWTSFQPNFFVQFQAGVLEEAPKSFLATIAKLPFDQKNIIQNSIVKKLPNVTLIDVSRIVRRLTNISQQMSLALQFMAILSILVGFFVMYSIASHQANARKKDINLVKVLGAPFAFIRNIFILEFVILATLAAMLGMALSVAVSYAISSLLFESLWNWNPLVPVISLLAVILIALFLSYYSINSVLQSKQQLEI